jgi:hypothetical protein
MYDSHYLTDDQAAWLKRILDSRENTSLFEQLAVPDDVANVLVAKGFVRRWRNGSVEITLGGIREVTRRPFALDQEPVDERMTA